MDSRQRLLTALDGGEPDRLPCALSFYNQDVQSLLPPGREDDGWVDIEFVSFPISAEERELRRKAQPYEGDSRLGTASQVANYTRWGYFPQHMQKGNPLAQAQSLDDLERFPFPDIEKPINTDGLTRKVRQIQERGVAAGGNPPHLGGELFEAAWRLRGLENFLLDLIERPEWAHFLLDRLTELATRNADALGRAGVDVLALDDDVGMPTSMMISPKHWREFFKSRMEKIIRAGRTHQPALRVVFHSDGYFEPIVDDLIEIGVNAINPVQPEYMPAARIRRRYGNRLALWGTVGAQGTFSFGNPEQIRQEVRQRVDELGRSGLVLCPAYDIDEPDIPRENIWAFLEAVKEFG